MGHPGGPKASKEAVQAKIRDIKKKVDQNPHKHKNEVADISKMKIKRSPKILSKKNDMTVKKEKRFPSQEQEFPWPLSHHPYQVQFQYPIGD